MLVKAGQDLPAASRLIDEAFAVLDETVASNRDDGKGPAVVANPPAPLLYPGSG